MTIDVVNIYLGGYDHSTHGEYTGGGRGTSLLNRTSEQRLARAAGRGAGRSGRTAGRDGARPPFRLGVLDNHLGYFIRRIQVWVFQDFMRTLARADIRPAQYSVLAVIEANPGLSQSDLADFLGIERARLARLLDRLEKRGYAERRASPRDRRSHALFLTREGHKALKRIKALAARHEARLAKKIGPEKRQLMIELLREFGR
ncbi:MAG: MarR family transcriptional regulator [Bradyrhizobiaceae bacterium]|nr:MarR family transcriptional regulator [Bradyrhizobiaceae bacterium]